MIRFEKLTSRSGLFQVSFGLLLLFATPTGATDTRVETMGESALFLEDEDNIWYFPAAIFEYPNLMVLSLGGQAGTLTPQSKLRTLGTISLPRGMVLGAGFGAEVKQVTYAPLDAAELLHLFWGFRDSSNQYGLSISQYGAVNSRPPSYEKLVSLTQVVAGISSEQASGNNVELALAYSGTYFKDIRNGTKKSVPKGYHELALRVRNSIPLENVTAIIMVFTATFGAHGAISDPSSPDAETFKEIYFTSRLGAAYEIQHPEDLLIILHASALYGRTVTSPADTKTITWDLPQAGLGVEKWIRPWLALRAGAILQLQLRKNVAPSGRTLSSEVSTAPTMGLAIRLSDLQADFALDPEVLKNGLYFMSGKTAPLFNKVTLRYNF